MKAKLKIAAEATKLAQEIWASFPITARQVYALRGLFKLAFGNDATSLGIAIITAMHKAGIEGELSPTGKTVAELGEAIKRNRISTVKKSAEALGNFARTRINKYSDQIKEDATSEMIIQLFTSGFSSGASIAQALSYVQNGLVNYANRKVRNDKRHQRAQEGMSREDIFNFISNPKQISREIPHSVWDKVLDDLKKKPMLQDSQGQPRLYQYITGLLSGMSMSQIADQMGIHRRNIEVWMREPYRLKALQKVLEPLYEYMTGD